MKICFFSDVHGNKYALDAFLKQIADEDIDTFVFGGDFFGYYYYADECITKIRGLPNCHCILGNHDRYFLDIIEGKISVEDYLIPRYGNSYLDIVPKISDENIEFIKGLPLSYVLYIDGKKLGFFHNAPIGSSVDRVYPDTDLSEVCVGDLDVCFLGHTHHKMVREKDGVKIINPGSIGQARDGKGVSYVIFDTILNSCEFFTVAYDVVPLLKDIDLFDNGSGKLKELTLRKK